MLKIASQLSNKQALDLFYETKAYLEDLTRQTRLLDKQIKNQKEFSSFDQKDLLLFRNGHIRNTQSEREYLRKYRNIISEMFGNQCAICCDKLNGIEWDHFYYPKSQGYNFFLYHKSGRIINNAIPLCISCNRTKGAKPYNMVCNSEALERINKLNHQLSILITSEELKNSLF